MVCCSALWKVLALLTTDKKVGGSNPSGRGTVHKHDTLLRYGQASSENELSL